MLTTDDHDEFQALPFMLAPGSKMWRVVSLELRVPYFLVSFACKEGNVWISQAALIWNEDDLLDFCREAHNDSSRKIHQIALLVPPSASEIETWRVLTLKEIWMGRVSHQQEMVYVGINGERLVKSLITYDDSQIELIKLAYPLS